MKIVKTIIKNILPPIILKIIKKKKIIHAFKKKFKSIEDVKNIEKKVSNYIKDELENEKSEEFLHPKNIEFHSKYLIAPIVASLINDDISILEYGGGNNPVFSYIKNSTSKNVYSVVIEKKSFVEKFINKVPNEFQNNIIYLDSIDKVKLSKFDIIYFGNSIQYSDNHEELLKKIFRLKSKYIIISRTHFNLLDEDFFVIQNNILNNVFPYKMINFDRFIKFMKKNDYNLIFNVNYKREYFHEDIKELAYKDIIFKKNI
tara:strand:+ start:2988 stop:3764 length:777 start_codon:yes stop_codon:yes gene_type:complete